MKDRVPTQVLENGALRMEQFDASGNSLGYIYLRRADAPSEEGTPYSKNAVLTDETASALGLEAADNPTPNDAFAATAQKFENLSGVNGDIAYINRRIDALEKSELFEHTLYSANATVTIAKAGRYRITLVGRGGDGGRGAYSSGGTARGGGGGGGGAVCVVIMTLSAGDTKLITFDNGAVTLDGIATAGAGETGGHASSSSGVGSGGNGGAAASLSSQYSVALYNGSSGGKGISRYGGNQNGDGGDGGDVGYYLSAQMVANTGRTGHSGHGLYKSYNLGYGGAGGIATSRTTAESPASGGSAGVVVEYMGA